MSSVVASRLRMFLIIGGFVGGTLVGMKYAYKERTEISVRALVTVQFPFLCTVTFGFHRLDAFLDHCNPTDA